MLQIQFSRHMFSERFIHRIAHRAKIGSWMAVLRMFYTLCFLHQSRFFTLRCSTAKPILKIALKHDV